MTISILRFPAVVARTGLSRSTIYLRVSKGEFPAPVRLGERAIGWPSDAIDAWIESRSSELPIDQIDAIDLTAPPPPPPPRAFYFDTVDGREWVTLQWGGYDYSFDMDRITSPLALLQLLIHLCPKGWPGMTADELGEFVSQVCERKGWPIGPLPS